MNIEWILAGYFKNEFMGSEKLLYAHRWQAFEWDNRDDVDERVISLKFMPIYFVKSIQIHSHDPWSDFFNFLIIQLFVFFSFIAHSTTSLNVKWKLIWSFIIITRNDSIKS